MITTITNLYPMDIWGSFMDAARTWCANLFGGLMEFGMVIGIFVISIGAIAYFSHYNKGGLILIVHGIVGEIICSCLYMAITGATGPPDITIFFRAPIA